MATETGNAVTARWVGPDGYQLFDGTVLRSGFVIEGIGKDEAEASDYWEVISKPTKSDVPVADASPMRDDWSFGSEEGGGGTGRPELDAQVKDAPAPVDEVVLSSLPVAADGSSE